jgi:hypothetical protein
MKLKLIKLATLILISIFGFSIIATTPAFADCSNVCNSDCNVTQSVKDAAGCGNTAQEDNLPTVIVNILNAIIGVSGLVAVVFIIVGGVQYMTSTGDASKTKRAKDTILYAVIGLIVCVLAFAIVNFVIYNIIG